MNFDNIKNLLPDYAKDLKLNLSSLSRSELLNAPQLQGAFLTAAFSCHNAQLQQSVIDAIHADNSLIIGAKTAAALMAMNNIYYRFVHLTEDLKFSQLPAGLRMNAITTSGIDKTQFEMFSLVASAINGCGLCVKSHTQQLLKAGVSYEQIQELIRIASTMHAINTVITIEK